MTSEPHTRGSSGLSPESARSDRARILITDDRPEVMAMVQDALGRRYDCSFAGSLEEARAQLSVEAFQVAICDLRTSPESGIRQVEQIIRDHPTTVVLLITGADDPEITERTVRLGAHGYLVNPFWPGQLLITVKNALRRRELELALNAERSVNGEGALTSTEAEALSELWASRQETVERLALAIETHDRDTGEHVARMAEITAFLGAKLGFDSDRILLLRAAAPMHDVGKIATPDAILQKPGPLSAQERTEMERHTEVGHQILAHSKSELLQIAAMIALTHHERWDGNGYPHGLRGEDIPPEGRIVAVADVFDALLSDRCYRPEMTSDDAVALIRDGRGSQFDPLVADTLLDNVEEILALRIADPDGSAVAGPGEIETDGRPGSLERMRDRLFLRRRGDRGTPDELRDRRKSSQDRRQSVRDRESAGHELAGEGVDSLTGALRRRVGLTAIQREMDRAERVGDPLVLAFVDAVGLKQVNDTRGRLAGDMVLEDIVDCITELLRSYDLVTRVGGDEFVCALPGQTVAQAEARYTAIANRLSLRERGARMTVGFAARQPGDSLSQLVDRAELAMLRIRREGGAQPRT